MRSGGFVRKATLVLAFAVALFAGKALLADDFEDPICPSSITSPVTGFGSVEVEPGDVGGDWIDAKETIEPVLSVLLMTGSVEVSPGMGVTVEATPVFDCQVAETAP
jgi:hypothetical protein